MARDKDSHDFMPSVVAVMERPPSPHTRIVSALVVSLAVIAGFWAFTSRTDIIVSAQGEIVPAGRVKVVQAAAQGVVREILVDDGQVVDEGAALIKFDSTSIKAEETQLAIRRDQALLTVQRLRAELGEPVEIGGGVDLPPPAIETEEGLYEANRELFLETVSQLEHKRDEARAGREITLRQIDKLKARIDHLESRLVRTRVQAEAGLIPGREVDDMEFELNEARKELAIFKERLQETAIRINAARKKIQSARTERNGRLYQTLTEAEYELKSIEQDLIKTRRRGAYQVLRAPVSGIVQQLNVHTIGAVVQRGEKLLVVVPEDAGLQMDARILNKDVGFVDAEQPARVKVDAFEFTRYGHIDGRLQWVGSDAVVDEEKGTVYPARISLASMSMQNRVGGKDATVVPGMRATADIVIGERRLIEYFIAPLLRYKDESLRER